MGEVHDGIVGPYVLPTIERARSSIDVASPYLSPKYAELLLSKAKSGVRVRLITSTSNEEALSLLGHRSTESDHESAEGWGAVALVLVSLFLLFLLAVTASPPHLGGVALWGGCFAIGVVLILMVRRRSSHKRMVIPLEVRVPTDEFIHAKMYIIDGSVAITGSANLTYSAMNRNVEHVEVKTLPHEVKQVAQSFSRLWGRQSEEAREYEEETGQTRAGTGPVYREREIIREIVKIRCRHCGTPFEERLDKCPHCGAPA